MFIEIHIDGHDSPQLIEVGSKANKLAYELEKKGKKFRLGKVID